MRVIFHPVFWGVIATGVIIGFAVWLGTGATCNADGICHSRFETFLVSRPNEIGDTLAGFAGALAFVWIIVTVWLQSIELAAQREELQLTRKEMEGQCKASQDMARAMAAQAAIFEDEKRARDQDSAKQQFDETLTKFQDEFSNSNLVWTGKADEYGGIFEVLPVDFRGLKYQSVSQEHYFRVNIGNFQSMHNEIVSYIESGTIEEKPSSGNLFKAHRTLALALEIFERLSPSQKVRVQRLRLALFQEAIRSFLKADIWDDEK